VKTLEQLALEERYHRSVDFVSLARCMLRGDGSVSNALQVAMREKASPRVASILKAATGAGTLANVGGLVDLQIVSSGFLESLRNVGVFDAMLPSMARVPLDQRGLRIITTGISAYAVAEGAPKPISAFGLGTDKLDRLKADAIIIVTSELAENTTAAASAMLSRELRNAVVAETDATFVAALAAGAQPVASSGATVANVVTDISTALAAMSLHAGSRVFLVAAPLAAARLKLKLATAGATLGDITLIASDQIPAVGSPDEDLAMVIDASGIAADTAEVVLDNASHACIQMSTTPSAEAQSLVSLWQTNGKALRASRYFGFKLFRADAVQLISNVAW
jgi:hypothetical protein